LYLYTYNAIKKIGQAGSGLPFPYDNWHGFGLVDGDMGNELHELMKGRNVAGKWVRSQSRVSKTLHGWISRILTLLSSNLTAGQNMQTLRNRPWPFWGKLCELFNDVRQERTKRPRGTLKRVVDQMRAGEDPMAGQSLCTSLRY
jgi:hypothetical protein